MAPAIAGRIEATWAGVRRCYGVTAHQGSDLTPPGPRCCDCGQRRAQRRGGASTTLSPRRGRLPTPTTRVRWDPAPGADRLSHVCLACSPSGRKGRHSSLLGAPRSASYTGSSAPLCTRPGDAGPVWQYAPAPLHFHPLRCRRDGIGLPTSLYPPSQVFVQEADDVAHHLLGPPLLGGVGVAPQEGQVAVV